MTDIEDPKALLDYLLPQAEALVEGKKMGLLPMSGLGEASQAFWRIENVAGIHVFRQPGGWCADVELQGLPQGISNVIGTPVQSPLPSRDDAIQFAIQTLAMLIAMSRQAGKPIPTEAVFLYQGYEIRLPLKLIEMIAKFQPSDNSDHARKRLMDMDALLAPFDEARINGMTSELHREFVAVVSIALVAGILRWPEMKPPAEGTAH